MDFELQKVINTNDGITFEPIEVFKNTDYEIVTNELVERFGRCNVRNTSIESPNTWFRPYNSNDEYVLTCLGES